MKKVLILLCILAPHFIMIGQSSRGSQDPKMPREKVYLHLNSTFLVTGESLFYKVYCINKAEQKLSSLSKIAYVELIKNDHEVIFKQKIWLEEGQGQGDFFVPSSVFSGNYKLIAYTQWMRNGKLEEIFEQDILLINPFQEDQANMLRTDSIEQTKATELFREPLKTYPNTDISIDLNNSGFETRQLCTFQIAASEGYYGNYSVSVRQKDQIPAPQRKPFVKSDNVMTDHDKYLPTSLVSSALLPELRGEILRGIVRNKENKQPAENIQMALSIPERNYIFKIVSSNEKGEFFFILDKDYRTSKGVVQIVGSDAETCEFELLSAPQINYAELEFKSYGINKKDKEAILSKSINNQIQNAYAESHQDSVPPQKDYPPFYEINTYDYFLDDYTRYPSIKETILEIVEMAYTRQRQQKSYIHAKVLSDGNERGLNTLLLIDGLYIQEHDAVINARASKIKKISVYNQPYVYGSEIFEGIVSMESFDGDFLKDLPTYSSTAVDLLTPLPKKIYFQPNHRDNNTERIPDQRVQLLWNPDTEISRPKNEYQFYTSDLKGSFEIILEGYTKKGTPVSLTRSFEVK